MPRRCLSSIAYVCTDADLAICIASFSLESFGKLICHSWLMIRTPSASEGSHRQGGKTPGTGPDRQKNVTRWSTTHCQVSSNLVSAVRILTLDLDLNLNPRVRFHSKAPWLKVNWDAISSRDRKQSKNGMTINGLLNTQTRPQIQRGRIWQSLNHDPHPVCWDLLVM
ncbi:hypothetical protein EDB82DRAFT_134934 [Fusarium venenatum]|uniref:uncharacterized protein n=1 Tax=Fusarium venenatum TaxID=56646 RepID=UPI001D6C1B34|nr:hypothetical protein EDB82DRAFT_134934 [Fusarium venenatum]